MFIFHPSPRVGKHSLWMGKQYNIYSSIICLFTTYLHVIIKIECKRYSPLFIFSEQPVGIDLLKSQIIKLIIKTSDKINVISSLI